MRVLTVVRDFGRRGTQRVAENFSSAYVRLGHEVAVLAFEHDGPRLGNYKEQGIDVLPPYVGAAEGVLRRARAFNPELIHIHRSGVTRADETELLKALKNNDNCVLETNVFSRFDPVADPHIDLHGQLTRAGLYRWQSLENERSRGVGFYLPNLLNYEVWQAPPVERRHQLRRRLDIPPEGIVLGTIGKTDAALATVLRQVLSGSSVIHWVGVHSEETQKLVSALPSELKTRCHLLEQTDSDTILTHYYSLFDLLLHWSSNGESFGMVLAESIAVGTPIVMPLQLHRDIGGVEVVGHEEGGLIAGSSRSLAHTCEVALASLPRLRETVVAAQTRHRNEYEMMTVAARATLAAQAILGAAGDRKQRSARLEELGLQVRVSRQAMDELLSRHVGKKSALEAALFVATHHARLNDVRRLAQEFRLR